MQKWTTYDADDIAAGLQEFLICVEMFFAALAHAHSFPPRDYMDPAGSVPKGFKRNIRIMFDVTDVVDDVQGVVDDTVSTLYPSRTSSNTSAAMACTPACPRKSLLLLDAWSAQASGNLLVERLPSGHAAVCRSGTCL